MKSYPRRSTGLALVAAAAVAFALEASCRTAPPAGPLPIEPAPITAPLESFVAPPTIRVGILTEATRVSIGADSGVTVWARGRRSELQRSTFLTIAPASIPPRFRVQVASLADEKSAGRVGEQARLAAGETPAVRFNAQTGTYQVRVGDFATREEARSLADRLARSGLTGAWVAEEMPAQGTGRSRLVETGEELQSALVTPARSGEGLFVDGAPYRGVLEVRSNESGTLTVVNVVNLEDYLKGVVPNEMSPQAFPQIEALKAQAVAARTYALRKRGQFQEKGYDICATPACQVYRGRASESPLTDQAVEATRGLVATYQGAPINALYTSTCGGHTEDGENIFEGEGAPYLRGVACAPERSAWGAIRTLAPTKALGDEPGLSRDVALLISLGVLEPRTYDAAALKGAASEAEVRGWTSRLVSALKRKGCASASDPPLNRRGSFFSHLVGSLCWEERGRRLLSPGDPDYLLQVEDRTALADEGERLAAALLMAEGILSPLADNTLRPGVVLSRVQAVRLLAGAAGRAGVPGLLTGEFQGVEGGELEVKRGETIESHPLEREVRLFRALDGSRFVASELSLAVGDKVSFVLQDGRVTFLEAEQSRLGAAADHTSRYYRWEVRLTPADVERSISRYGSVGLVRDVVPKRLGVSGRVVELLVTGSQGELLLRGLQIRSALGLRENLFVVDRERRADGSVERFIFTGKGWGHGVGLCQVGASGMAQSGAKAGDILRHYYSGISLVDAY